MDPRVRRDDIRVDILRETACGGIEVGQEPTQIIKGGVQYGPKLVNIWLIIIFCNIFPKSYNVTKYKLIVFVDPRIRRDDIGGHLGREDAPGSSEWMT